MVSKNVYEKELAYVVCVHHTLSNVGTLLKFSRTIYTEESNKKEITIFRLEELKSYFAV